MSKGFGKKALLHNKKGSKSNNSTSSKTATPSPAEDDQLMVKFVFEGEKFYARTPIMFEQLSLSDLLKKVTLDITLPPPSAKELFETYFKEDIYPYVRHNIQSQTRNKRDVTKLWDLQSIILQKIYEQRAELLRLEWLRLRKKSDLNTNSNNTNIMNDDQIELQRKKAQLKAKNKANKQKWKDEIALQIASGQFDEPEPIKKSEINKKEKKKKKIKKKNKKKDSKPKQTKKKKIKKWKDKKIKKQAEWPGIVPKQIPIANTVYNKNKKSAGRQLKENLKKLEEKNNNIKRQSIISELKYKLIIKCENNNEFIIENNNDNNNKQIELIKNGIESKKDELINIKISIYMSEITIENNKEEIWLNTNKNEILLTVNNVKLFEILWNDLVNGINKRIDENNIGVVFVKKRKMLRVKIPILAV